jgi:Oligosaccharyltransferase 48 kDa subunit beta
VLLGLSSDTGTPSAILSLLLEFDIALSPHKSSVVVHHFNYDTVSAAERHDVFLVQRPGQLRPDVTNFFGGDGLLAVPKAVGQTLGNASPLLAPILKAPVSAYAYNLKEEIVSVEEPFAAGSQLALISTMQARNSARFTVLGSLEMLQDKWFDASFKSPSGKSSKTRNQEFARQLTEWTFKEVGVLKVFNIYHHEITASSKTSQNTTALGEYNPEIYRIKNNVVCLCLGTFPRRCLTCLFALEILHRDRPVRSNTFRSLHSSRNRCPPTRIHHAVTFSPYTPLSRLHDPEQHSLRDDIHYTRPTRHLRLQSQLQVALPHVRRGKAAGHRETLCAR